MKSIKPIPLVLENAGGKVIRSFNWTQPKLYLVTQKSTGRLEAMSSFTKSEAHTEGLTLVQSFDVAKMADQPIKVTGVGTLRRLSEDESISYIANPIEIENDEGFSKILKWSAVVHGVVLFLIFSAFWTHELLIKEETPTVKIKPLTKTVVPKAKPTVQASKKKINRNKKVAKKVRSKVKPKRRVRKQARKSVNQMGALGALGGTSKGSKRGNGLKLKSALRNSGSGDSAGTKSLGSASSSLAGKALSARSGGGGKTDLGQVGYGTKGRAGGQAGYGQLNIGGGSGGYEHPMQEDGTVNGGLEMSQIEAVIKRNIGQIFYCYEMGLQTKPDLSGRVVTNFIIGGSGRVSMVQVGRSSLKSAGVESCMTKKIKSWKFPKPHGNVNVNVTYPFTLKRARQG